MEKADVLLVTVNQHETQAILAAFAKATGRDAIQLPIGGRVYRDLGVINKTHVFHALSEMGSTGLGGALQTVDKGIQALNPSAVIAVGIAFGVNESRQSIGDVLISKQLRLYELQRAGDEISLRGDKPHASAALINFFEGIAQSVWKGQTVRSGVLLTGEKLVDNVDYRRQLLKFDVEAIGGEMEAAGLYVASHDRKIDWIVIKAICDWADGNKSRNKTARQTKAARNAAEFLLFALQQAPLAALYGSLENAHNPSDAMVSARSLAHRQLATPPSPFFIHPYSLLQTADVIGRDEELSMLDQWGESVDSIATVVSIGGMGKSALTWKWFLERATDHVNSISGRIWWSFYEEDSSFGNFVKHALAYVTNQQPDTIREPYPAQLEHLHHELTQRSWLISFDGFERQLRAYSRLDTSQAILRMESHTEPADRCSDERVATFLQRFARQNVSKLLISSRLVPSELTTVADRPLPRTQILPLRGLKTNAAIQLWQQLGNSGTPEEMSEFFETFDGHPLLIQALGREVATWRESPGDFGAWRRANPEFDPFELPLHQRRSHILQFATKNLSSNEQRVLQTVAHFRVPSHYLQLRGLLVGANAVFSTVDSFDSCLRDLERRGLLSWERRSNTYDMHPVIRGFVWSGLKDSQHSLYYAEIEEYFKSVPTPAAREVSSITQLSPAIELFNALVRTRQYEEAYLVFTARLKGPLRTLVAGRLTQLLLHEFFLDPHDPSTCLLDGRTGGDYQTPLMRYLANTHIVLGQPRRCRDLLVSAAAVSAARGDWVSQITLLGHLAVSYCVLGALRDAEKCLHDSRKMQIGEGVNCSPKSGRFLRIGECETHIWAGFLASIRGNDTDAKTELNRGIEVATAQRLHEYQGLGLAIRGRHEFWMGRFMEAKNSARAAMQIAEECKRDRDRVHVGALLGSVALECGEIEDARTVIICARQRAVEREYVSGEIAVACAEARLLIREGNIEQCIGMCDEVIARAGESGYRLELVDLLISRARCHQMRNRMEMAHHDANRAFELSRCDGDDYSFVWGMRCANDVMRQIAEAAK